MAKNTENRVFEVGVFVHEDGDHADVGEEAAGPPDDVLFRKPQLTGRVETSIVNGVVITLRKELHGSIRPAMARVTQASNRPATALTFHAI
jgi:hypothetical protein